MFYNHLCLIITANTCNHTAVSGLLHHHQFNRRHKWPLFTSRPPPSVRDMIVWHWQRNNPRWWLYIMVLTSGNPTGTIGTTIGITRWIDSLLHSSQTSHPRQPLWGTSNAVRRISSGSREDSLEIKCMRTSGVRCRRLTVASRSLAQSNKHRDASGWQCAHSSHSQLNNTLERLRPRVRSH